MTGSRLETERLLLRRWTGADRAQFAALNADPDVMRYFPAPLSATQSDALVDRIEAVFDQHGFGMWALQVKGGARFIGCAGLAPLNPQVPHPGIEVGWRLARAAWGHGYATEAARAAVGYGFDVAGLHEVVSVTAATNLPSRAVMVRLAMTHDPAEDFDHPALADDSPLRRHVLYRLPRATGPAATGSSAAPIR